MLADVRIDLDECFFGLWVAIEDQRSDFGAFSRGFVVVLSRHVVVQFLSNQSENEKIKDIGNWDGIGGCILDDSIQAIRPQNDAECNRWSQRWRW